MDELEKRVAERRAELTRRESSWERFDKLADDLPELAMLVIEYLMAFIGVLFAVAGKPNAACASFLLAIYLKVPR